MKKSQLVLWICIIIIFLLVVQILFSFPAPNKWLEAAWGAGDFISFVGTVSLGLVAVYQTKKANEISFRLLQIEEERRRPQIDIRAISKDKLRQYNLQQLISTSTEGIFVHVNSEWEEDANEGENFWFDIKNVKDMDIINIQPTIITFEIIDSNNNCVASNKYSLLCMPTKKLRKSFCPHRRASPRIYCSRNAVGRRCGHAGQELVLVRFFRACARVGNFDRRDFSRRLSDVSGRVSSHRLRL